MITLQNIKKSYQVGPESVEVLKGIDIEIEQGDFVAIMGTSGSGKSTLMNIIGLLDTPSSGKYFLEWDDVSSLSEGKKSKIRGHKIGFVFQNYSLIPRLSVLKQVMLPLTYQWVGESETKKRSLEALEKVGLLPKQKSQPSELSGGQKQRVAIARAIVIRPALILADEPTGALDTKTSTEVMEIFRSLHEEGKTIVLITHEPDIAAWAKKIIHVRDGEIITSN